MCGLAGLINNHPKKFDYTTFCTLGVANDARGGDSCGIFIDGTYDYGVNEYRYFSNYFIDNKLLSSIKKAQIALVHCRKASVGSVGLTTAQPVIINNEFVVMHNGTILNVEELAGKYAPDLDTFDMTDSQVMAHIFYRKGYDVLNDYVGSGAFVIVDYRKSSPLVLFFKGASKETWTAAVKEERPLYGCITGQDLVFSSISTYLYALRRDANVFTFPNNMLVAFDEGTLKRVRAYDRSDKVQYTSYASYYDPYVDTDYVTNSYLLNGKAAHGMLSLSQWGKIDKLGTERFFFHGILMRNKKCWEFLNDLEKEYKRDDFCYRFQNVIRYLSVNPIYKRSGLWYKALSVFSFGLYSGAHQMLTSTIVWMIEDGQKRGVTYGNNMATVVDVDYNFQTIRKQCGSLMN